MVPVVSHSVEPWGKVRDLQIYTPTARRGAGWRESFRRAERYIVGGNGIKKDGAWQRDDRTTRQELEKERIGKEARDANLKIYYADKFARQVNAGDAELLMSGPRRLVPLTQVSLYS